MYKLIVQKNCQRSTKNLSYDLEIEQDKLKSSHRWLCTDLTKFEDEFVQ